MNKLLASLVIVLSCVALPASALAAPASPAAIQRVPAWNMVGDYTISFGCAACVPHFMRIASSNVLAGTFAGSGFYIPNPAFTWTVNGTVNDNQVAMHILYTGAGAGYFVDLTGTIAPDGSMSGSATDASHDSFAWLTVSGQATAYTNHGDFVRSQTDKQAAARSNFGKPTSSQGEHASPWPAPYAENKK